MSFDPLRKNSSFTGPLREYFSSETSRKGDRHLCPALKKKGVFVKSLIRKALVMSLALMLLLGTALLTVSPAAHAASTLTVTTTADLSSCTAGMLSLRCAINQANNDGSGDTIVFKIPATDPGCTARASNGSPICTISVTSSILGLPALTATNTVINGYTQPGAHANTNPLSSGDNAILTLHIDGGSAHNTEFGFLLSGTGDTVEGFSVTSFTTDISAGASNTIQGNFIGLEPDGLTPSVDETGLSSGDGTTIGGTSSASRNVISGNSTEAELGNGNTFQGNIVGLNAAGNAAVINLLAGGFPGDGVFVGNNDLIGGTTSGAGNIISGNASGIRLAGASSTLIEGNLIGTDITGKVAIGNEEGITSSFSSSKNTIGGLVPAARNIISGNFNFGIDLAEGSNNVVEGNYIGTDVTGEVALANGGNNGASAQNSAGVLLTTGSTVNLNNNTIGGTTSAARNVISGNAFNGIQITVEDRGGSTGITENNLIEGNSIGLDATGTKALGNGTNGVYVASSQGFTGQILNNSIQNNVIAHNGQSGILVGLSATDTHVHTPISQNSIFANGGLGIDLAPQGVINTNTPPPGPNDYTPAPVIAQATTTQVSGTAPANTRVEVFIVSNDANDQGHGEGQTFLGSAVVGANGNWSLALAAGSVSPGQLVTATTTTSGTNTETSEFAANVAVH